MWTVPWSLWHVSVASCGHSLVIMRLHTEFYLFRIFTSNVSVYLTSPSGLFSPLNPKSGLRVWICVSVFASAKPCQVYILIRPWNLCSPPRRNEAKENFPSCFLCELAHAPAFLRVLEYYSLGSQAFSKHLNIPSAKKTKQEICLVY